ncbi:hypothetical protein ANCCEY_10085 [Ancylostoma ceylanicum]|uniref:PiggyBac transposable element-derived protein domain-containing protein n=1 Tax=Ancylostoma ceylanicum TaxID=53326 RepID=A0A0D6LLG1_9BILA|nr:hypothetical protein ANCCEY_10085 [Ancylostoma ceylanicum]
MKACYSNEAQDNINQKPSHLKANSNNELSINSFRYSKVDELDASFDRLLIESEDEVDIFGDVHDAVVPAVRSAVMRPISNILAEPLCQFFNSMIKEKTVPEDLAFAHTVLLYKSGDPANIANYRPISLLSALYKAKYATWDSLDGRECFNFPAMCFHMGIERRPNLKDYWSTRQVFSQSLAAEYMTRFVQILNSLHFVDNSNADKSDRLNKTDAVMKILNRTFAEVHKLGREVCIDESMIPFRGRVLFRRPLRGKRYKYGLKLL